MRKLGYTLLILGALYFGFWSFYVVLEAPFYAERYMDQFLTTSEWTRGKVMEFLQAIMSEFAMEIVPKFLVGAALMLCGGICLDIAGRRKRAQPNTALEPTATAP